MAKRSVGATAGTKPCRYCAKPIPLSATYCTECEQFQNWRRFLTFSTTMIALVTALISVVATTAPTLMRYLQPAYTKLTIAPLSNVGRELVFLVSNEGTRPGGIGSTSLMYGNELSDTAEELMWLEPSKGSEATFILGGETKQLTLVPRFPTRFDFDKPFRTLDPNVECTVTLETTDFQGIREQRRLSDNCSFFRDFFLANYDLSKQTQPPVSSDQPP